MKQSADPYGIALLIDDVVAFLDLRAFLSQNWIGSQITQSVIQPRPLVTTVKTRLSCIMLLMMVIASSRAFCRSRNGGKGIPKLANLVGIPAAA
jgi:hypothetical protein